MIRLLGVNLLENRPLFIELTKIYGIGLKTSKKILKNLNISEVIKTKELSDKEIFQLREFFQKSTLMLEGSLKKFIGLNIKRLIDINSYRGRRHSKNLPVRGQRTRTNSRTIRQIKNNLIIK